MLNNLIVPEFKLTIDNDKSWLIRLSNDGVFTFNTEEFPEMTANDFAKEFVEKVYSYVNFQPSEQSDK